MKRVRWELEEAVVLYDVYLKSGCSLNVEKSILENLSEIMKRRAIKKGIEIDDKFRNVTGLSMQIGCIHYIATDGKEGLSNASKIFYDAHDLYERDRDKFNSIVDEFYRKYDD